VLDFIASGILSQGDPKLFHPLIENLLWDDPFLLLADYQSYVDCQNAVSALWADPVAWTRKSILNVARMGKFSSDRSIREYCERVWKVTPSQVNMK
jgi:glycogen phosphorylase